MAKIDANFFMKFALNLSKGASGEIRTPNICFEGKDDIHFTTEAELIFKHYRNTLLPAEYSFQ